MRPKVEYTELDNGSWDVSAKDTWMGWLKPSTYGVWVFVDGQYVEYNSEQLRSIADQLDVVNRNEDIKDEPPERPDQDQGDGDYHFTPS